MPTPVTTARQCLTPEASQALDDAVSVACRRSHAQTSSLHAVSALLSLPSSPLREACRRVRNSAYISRVQFKALELCLGVSLDRLPSSPQRVGEPPVSNSLMAAIKRSQANQRRQPENFHLYQQTASFPPSCTSVSTVKVELQNLILSILDDPVVSRVFGESGFRSSDIKLSILRPVHHQLFRYKGPPVFLCNLTNDFSFPFRGVLDHDENCKRIIETLARKHGENRNNPLLVGASAIDALKNFLETLQKRKSGGFFPQELPDLAVTSVKDEIFDFVNGNSDVGLLKLRLEEVGNLLKESITSGVVVELGDLKVLIGQNLLVDVETVVRELCDLLEAHGGRVWLIGTAENQEIYSEFCKKFPTVEKDLGLHVLPISSIKSRMAETFPKSSLMESFVPFGGFFSMPSEMTSPLSILNRYGSLCRLCDDKFKREVQALAEGGLSGSVCDPHRSTLPSWLHTSPLHLNRESDLSKARDEPVVLTAKASGLQRKWANICQRLHRAEHYTQIGFQVKLHSLSTESQCDTVPKSNLNDTTSPVSGNSVTTDLGLGVHRSPRISETALVKSSFPQKDYKTLCSSLFTKVGRQEEAVSVVSRTINGGRQGGIWFAFVGPDRIAKKKLAVALAEVLYGSDGNVISVDLSGRGFIDGCDQRLRGKNMVDFVADELRKKQLSVVFLENMDMADTVTQHHLSRAVSTRRFCDSHGREVGVSNSIFVLTSRLSGNLDLEGVDSAEENVINVRKPKNGTIHMLTGFDLGDGKRRRKVVKFTKSQHKRKLVDTAEAAKRTHLDLDLDLNLPAGETDSAPEKAWLLDFLKRVDKKVVFEPFDFERLSEKVLERIGECFKRVIGFECLLEIDSEVMEQIVGAAYCVETEEVEEWIEGVLGKAFEAGRRKYGLGAHSFVQLVGCEAPEEEEGEESAGVFLPGTVTMN